MVEGTRRGRQAAVERRIRSALEGIRALLPMEAAGVELVEFEMENGVAVLRLSGDCPHCDLTAEHLRAGIEANLRQRVPEILEVRAV
ncbi:MAG TPA: NifU family protein [Gemmatimonadaceae bacterium]|nr:NifU family protein [Gemmatimonadaceae bacterium]